MTHFEILATVVFFVQFLTMLYLYERIVYLTRKVQNLWTVLAAMGRNDA